jgi:hypothetical protein
MKASKKLQSQHSYERVVEELHWFVKKMSQGYDKVRKHFVGDMITGMIRSGSCLLSSISRTVRRRDVLPHSEEKRLSYEVNSKRWRSQGMVSNQRALIGRKYVDAETVVALDLSDINKEHGQAYEHLTQVHDGSTGEIVSGYWTIVIEAIKGKGRHLPLLMKVFTDRLEGYKSQFEEVSKSVESVVKDFGTSGLWVMDRGFDSLRNFMYFNGLKLCFLIRGYHERIVEEVEGVPVKLMQLIEQKTLRGVDPFYKQYVVGSKGHRRSWQRREMKIRYDYFPVCMIHGSDEEKQERARLHLYVIVIEGMGKAGERSFFFTNYPLGTLADCHRVVKKYAQRWSCEEAIRFVKQGFQLEDVRVQRYHAIQRMMEFCMVCYTFVCLFIERSTRYKRVFWWLHELTITGRSRPRFAHYRILDAMQKMLNLDFISQNTVFAR